MARPLKPTYLLLLFTSDLIITLYYGIEHIGKPMRAVNLVTLLALGITVGAMLTKIFMVMREGRTISN